MNKAESIITKFGLKPHIEGGYFTEIYKNPYSITNKDIGVDFEGPRPLASTIYYLLKSKQVSKFHKLRFDEQWFFHEGSPLLIHLIDEVGNLNSFKLGTNIYMDETPQLLVKAGIVLGAQVVENNSFCFVSCVVTPGFDYRDFTLYDSNELIKQYPEHQDLIKNFNE